MKILKGYFTIKFAFVKGFLGFAGQYMVLFSV